MGDVFILAPIDFVDEHEFEGSGSAVRLLVCEIARYLKSAA